MFVCVGGGGGGREGNAAPSGHAARSAAPQAAGDVGSAPVQGAAATPIHPSHSSPPPPPPRQVWFPSNYTSIPSTFGGLSAYEYFVFLLNKLPSLAFTLSAFPLFKPTGVTVGWLGGGAVPRGGLVGWRGGAPGSGRGLHLLCCSSPCWQQGSHALRPCCCSIKLPYRLVTVPHTEPLPLRLHPRAASCRLAATSRAPPRERSPSAHGLQPPHQPQAAPAAAAAPPPPPAGPLCKWWMWMSAT